MVKIIRKRFHGVFLESVEGGENLGRWVLLLLNLFGKQFVMVKKIVKTWNNGKEEIHKGDPFNMLRNWTKI